MQDSHNIIGGSDAAHGHDPGQSGIDRPRGSVGCVGAARVVCAWCDVDLGPTSCAVVTHGICRPCARALEAGEERPEWRETMARALKVTDAINAKLRALARE